MARHVVIGSWLLLSTCGPALALCGGALIGCGGPAAPTREWTPADHGQPATPEAAGERAAPELAEGEDPERRAARALFNASCASCHGRDGRGQGEQRPPVAQIPDFTAQAWQASRSDAQLAQVIVDGRGMMPPFGKQVNEHGIAALVRHVRAFATPAAVPDTAQTPTAADNPAPHP